MGSSAGSDEYELALPEEQFAFVAIKGSIGGMLGLVGYSVLRSRSRFCFSDSLEQIQFVYAALEDGRSNTKKLVDTKARVTAPFDSTTGRGETYTHVFDDLSETIKESLRQGWRLKAIKCVFYMSVDDCDLSF